MGKRIRSWNMKNKLGISLLYIFRQIYTEQIWGWDKCAAATKRRRQWECYKEMCPSVLELGSVTARQRGLVTLLTSLRPHSPPQLSGGIACHHFSIIPRFISMQNCRRPSHLHPRYLSIYVADLSIKWDLRNVLKCKGKRMSVLSYLSIRPILHPRKGHSYFYL